jgi:hypothetical protein
MLSFVTGKRSYFRTFCIHLSVDVLARPPCETLASSFSVVGAGQTGKRRKSLKGGERMLERLLDIEVSEHGTVTEEIELICTMTGFRRRLLIHHIGEGFFRSVELGPS